MQGLFTIWTFVVFNSYIYFHIFPLRRCIETPYQLPILIPLSSSKYADQNFNTDLEDYIHDLLVGNAGSKSLTNLKGSNNTFLCLFLKERVRCNETSFPDDKIFIIHHYELIIWKCFSNTKSMTNAWALIFFSLIHSFRFETFKFYKFDIIIHDQKWDFRKVTWVDVRLLIFLHLLP